MNLTKQQKQNCIDAGKFEFKTKQLAALLMLPVEEVKKALDDPKNEISIYYTMGKNRDVIDSLISKMG